MHLNFLKLNKQHSYVLAIALLQSIALLGMHHWVQNLPKTDAYLVWILPLYTLILLAPLSLMMLAHVARKPAVMLTVLFSLLTALSAMHIGHVNFVPTLSSGNEFVPFIFSLSAFVIWFIALAFAEHFCVYRTWTQHYTALHDFAWRNIIKLLTASIFVGLFWAALALLAGLFSILHIRFFSDLISNRYFAYPATTLAFGMGLSLYAAKEEALSEFKRATLQVLGWLLPLVSLILLGFAGTLCVTGLSALWSTGYATNLMLCLMVLMVLLFNAAFQEGNTPQYPTWFLKLTQLGLIAMPVYSALSLYAIYLRTEQYGWTTDRVWAMVAVILASVYAWGYAYSSLQSFKKNAIWMHRAKAVNIFAALLMIGLLFALHTPPLNPMRIAVSSQVDRLIANKVTASAFDYSYLRFHGGRYGDLALHALMSNQQLRDAPAVQKAVEDILKQNYPSYQPSKQPHQNLDVFKAAFTIYPNGQVLDRDLISAMYEKYTKNNQYEICLNTLMSPPPQCSILMIDLNQDKVLEAVTDTGLQYQTHDVYVKNEHGWEYRGELMRLNNPQNSQEPNANAIKQGNYKTVNPPWQILKIDNQQFIINDVASTQE